MLLAQYLCKGFKIGKAPCSLALKSDYWCSSTVPTPVSTMEIFHCSASKGKLYPVLCGLLSPSLARHTTICTTRTDTHRDPKKTRENHQLNRDRKAQKLNNLHNIPYLS